MTGEFRTFKETSEAARVLKVLNQKQIQSCKKKRKKFAKLGQLVPVNLEIEKERFFRSRYKYNPQFIYSFERLSFPVELTSTKSPTRVS